MMPDKRDLDFDYVKGMVTTLCEQIEDDEWKPDYIVGLVRGGLIPAVLLSHKLDAPMVAVKWSTRDHEECESNCWLPELATEGKNILVVDDLVDSGRTIEELKEDWQKSVTTELKWGENIRLACLQQRSTCPITPDYVAEVITNEAWQVYPWEL